MAQKVIELNGVRCIDGRTNIGLYENHLIDTAVVDVPLDLETILITHGHADNFAFASALKKRTGALVVVPREDAFLIENREVNVRGMFSRARPPVEMTTRFFIGAPCTVDRHVEAYAFKGAITPVPLAGHTLGTRPICATRYSLQETRFTRQRCGGEISSLIRSTSNSPAGRSTR